MKRFLILFLCIFSISFADTLILTKGKYATYIQEEEFMVAQGENLIGPISILPIGDYNAIKISTTGGSTISSYILEKTSLDWKKNLIGKHITIEGEGRIIRGDVISINGKYITINSKKGFMVTTLPEFPSRISSPERWEELFSPQITLKVNSNEAKSEIFKIKYPIQGVSWKVHYILDIKNGKKYLTGYLIIDNNTVVDFRKVNLIIWEMKNKKFSEISIPPHTEKRIKIIQQEINQRISGLINGEVSVYKNGIFVKNTTLSAVLP